MKRNKDNQTLTLETYQKGSRIAGVALALLLGCVLTALRAPFVSTLPLLVLAPFLCRLFYSKPLYIILIALPCGAVAGALTGDFVQALFITLASAAGAVAGVLSATLLKTTWSRFSGLVRLIGATAAAALLLIASYASFNLFGNPVGYIAAAVQSQNYVSAAYGPGELAFKGVDYNPKERVHNGIFQTDLNGTPGRVEIGFNRKGEPADEYQAALANLFLSECNAELQREAAIACENRPLTVTATADKPLGLTKILLQGELGRLDSQSEQGKQAAARREDARAKLSYTISFSKAEDSAAEPDKEQLLRMAGAVKEHLAQTGIPYEKITVTAGDPYGNTQRTEFDMHAGEQQLNENYRVYKSEKE